MDAQQTLLFSRKRAAAALNISLRTLDYAIAAGLLETRRINKRVLIPTTSLERFASADRRIPTTRIDGVQDSIGTLPHFAPAIARA